MKITIGWYEALQIALIILRCTGAITWAWWWVLAPLWMPAALLVAVGVLTALALLIESIF